MWPLLRALCSGAALAWVLWRIPRHSIAAVWAHTELPGVAAGLALNVLVRFVAAERTQMVCRGLGLPVTRWQNIETLFISNFYALLSPGPVLSGVVSVYRYRGYGVSVGGSLSALLVSRALEAGAFLAVGAGCLWADPRVPWAAVRTPLMLAVATLAVLGLGLLGWILLNRARARSLFESTPAMVWRAALPATVQVLLSGAATALFAGAIGCKLSLLTAVWMTAAVYVAVLLPISIVGVGVRELTLLKGLALVGIDPQYAVALAGLLLADPLINALIGGLLQVRATVWAPRRAS